MFFGNEGRRSRIEMDSEFASRRPHLMQPINKTFNEVLIDDETAELLDFLAKYRGTNLPELFKSIGGNAESFRTFLSVIGFEYHFEGERILKLLERTYEGMLAETVRIRGYQGDEIDAYLARPLGVGPYAGVVMLHDMSGWDEATKEMVRKMAYHGYVSLPTFTFGKGRAAQKQTVPASERPEEYPTTMPWAMWKEQSSTCAGCPIITVTWVSSASALAGDRPTWPPVVSLASTLLLIVGAAVWLPRQKSLPSASQWLPLTTLQTSIAHC
jgi:hypothetical protein